MALFKMSSFSKDGNGNIAATILPLTAVSIRNDSMDRGLIDSRLNLLIL